MYNKNWLILLLFPLSLICSSCQWREAKAVITLADSLDQSQHLIWEDTATLAQTIRQLDNPLGRLFMHSTLGKAYYYMGRNLEDKYQQVAEAAECYIEADRLHIDDPIYRGRVNSCMGYICAQNNNDSLALIFYERANKDFQKSGEEWYCAQTLLDRSEFNINLQNYTVADSLLQIARTYQMGRAYQARYYETLGVYFYKQQQYDSALVYLTKGLDYWQTEEDKTFSCLKIMQIYYKLNLLDKALSYARFILQYSHNPNYISNAYYCLMLDANRKNDANLLNQYSQARADAMKLLLNQTNRYAEALPQLERYLSDPYPWRKGWIAISSFLIVFVVSGFVYWYRNQIARRQIYNLSAHLQDKEMRLSQELYYRQFGEKISVVIDRYHIPHKRWREYDNLKKDLNPWLHEWISRLDTLPLSDREKIFCTISLIYSHMTDVEIAEYLCYDKHGIRIFKSRILKKIGIHSSEFPTYLRNLSVGE